MTHHRKLTSNSARSFAIWFLLFALVGSTVNAGATKQGRARRGRVVLMSFDALGYQNWTHDPVTKELRALERIAAHGVTARGMIQAFPSVTPAGHAALWTGVYGNVSGVVAGENLLLPRDEHTVLEHRSGFRSETLKAEPLWISAARQGVRVVANEATQTFPLLPHVTGAGLPTPPVVVTGFGPELLTKNVVIGGRDVKWQDAGQEAVDGGAWQPALPKSSLPVRNFKWTTGPATFYGAMVAEGSRAKGYTALFIAASRSGPRVRVEPHEAESRAPHDRPLARYFSDPLQLTVGQRAIRTVAYFRLYELGRDGKSFLLYQPSLYELVLSDGGPDSAKVIDAMLTENGGFLGNGPSYIYRDGLLGPQLFAGGDGSAERRYLEGIELVVRQCTRLSEWLCKKYDPELLIDYSSYPDEFEHDWYGLARPDVTRVLLSIAGRINEFRRWGYAVVNRRMESMDRLAGPEGSLIIVSDHGMSPTAKEVNVSAVLRSAGLLAAGSSAKVDLARTKAVYQKYSVSVNTEDWRGGSVKFADKAAVVDSVERALKDVRDPEDWSPVFTQFFRPEKDGDALGIGGPAGGDLYFEIAPGYEAVSRDSDEVVRRVKVPRGDHGFLPTRPEMLASFIARGPRFPQGIQIPTIRSIDVASVVSDLLGIKPPAQNQGKLPEMLRAVHDKAQPVSR